MASSHALSLPDLGHEPEIARSHDVPGAQIFQLHPGSRPARRAAPPGSRPRSHLQLPTPGTAMVAAGAGARMLDAICAHAIIATDVNRVVTYFSAGAEKLLGYRADEIVGRREPTFFHDKGEIEARAAQLGVPVGPQLFSPEVGGGETSEWTFVHRDGRRFPVELTVNELRDAKGTFDGYIGVAQDITAAKRDQAAMHAHAAEQEALLAVATLVAGNAPSSAVFAAAARDAAHVLDGISCGVFRLEESGEARMVGCWSRADMPSLPIGELLDLNAPTATARTLRTGTDQSTAYETDQAGLQTGPALPLRSGVAALIAVDGRPWGAVGVGFDDTSASDPDALLRLSRFAALIGLAVTSAEAREKLSLIASTDHLTGLANQRIFSDRLDDEVRNARGRGTPLSLVLIDLDHFKLVNDTHGHDGGNRALSELAERVTTFGRTGDMLARIGGEEFAWILPGTSAAGAVEAAERVRVAISEIPFEGIGRLTVSAGCCSLDDAPTGRELFRRADLALYWAKSNGRNTVSRYSADTLALLSPDEQARSLEQARTLAAVRALAMAVDAKDSSTQRHSERVAELASELARIAGWDARRIALLHDAALVHDVGKIGIPDQLLLKPGRLTPAEHDQIKPHAALGARMVSELLSPEQVSWIRHHHERFDGTGYPDLLSGTDIPEGARILTVADTWDAMTVARPYGSPKGIDDALEECRRSAGGQLCPDAVAALLELHGLAA